MRMFFKIFIFALSLSCATAFATNQNSMSNNANSMATSQVNTQSMNQMVNNVLSYKFKKIGYKLMYKGLKYYGMGKYLAASNDNSMQAKGKQLMHIGMQMYSTGRMLAGKDLDLSKMKRGKWKRCPRK